MCDVCGNKLNRAIYFQHENDFKINVDKSVVSISHCDNNYTSNVKNENTHCKIFCRLVFCYSKRSYK